MLSEEEIKKAKKSLKKFCEYEDSLVLTDNVLYEYQEAIETLLQYIEELEKTDNELDKDNKTCFYEDGNTGKCLGYSSINDDEPCEYCKTCEALSVKGDD